MCKEVLLHSLTEASTVSKLHNDINHKLTELQSDMKKWKGEFYNKQMMGACKETKSFEEDFRKV